MILEIKITAVSAAEEGRIMQISGGWEGNGHEKRGTFNEL